MHFVTELKNLIAFYLPRRHHTASPRCVSNKNQSDLSRQSYRALLLVLALIFSEGSIAADISGTVYREYDFDGNQSALEPGVQDVDVVAYDDNGVAAATASTDSFGDYTLTGLTAGVIYRVEFINFPDYLSAAPQGVVSNTTTQFIAPVATGVDAGLGSGEQYCSVDPKIVTPLALQGDRADSDGALYSYQYTDSGQIGAPTGLNPDIAEEATYGQIGTTFGTAYLARYQSSPSDTSPGAVFASALVKRFGELGPGDGAGSNPTGSIYLVEDPGDGVVATNAQVSEFVNLNNLGTSTGVLTRTDFATTDTNAYAVAGKIGIGGITLNADQDTLYVVNLFDRNIYRLPLGSAVTPVAPTAGDVTGIDLAVTSSYVGGEAPVCDAGAADGGLNDNIRPYATESHDGRIYVGLVCSGEGGGDLKGFVYSFDEASNGLLSKSTEFDLTYDRGCGLVSGACTANDANWGEWSSVYPPVGLVSFGTERWAPQAMLSGIAFGSNNELIIGMRDRWGDQVGHNRLDPTGGPAIRGDSFGDLLRATDNGDGTWAFSVAEATNGTEYFPDIWDDPTTNYFHYETAQGSVLAFPALGTVLSSVMDPFRDWSGGHNVFDLGASSATISHELELYRAGTSSDSDYFGKSNSTGGIEVLCDVPPLEIGNRVWLDADNDGIQDPSESPIAGVTVELYDTDGITLLATAVTDAKGEYYFSSGLGTDTTNKKFNLALDPNTSGYQLKIDTSAGVISSNGYILTAANQGSDNNADSDASMVASDATIVLDTSSPGSSDHTFDFGFIEPMSLGDTVFVDLNEDGCRCDG